MNNPIPEHESYVQPSAGAQLRAYREHLQLTVDDVAHHLKLARRQVLAIENDELEALPGPTFVRGFIRNYARLLRIDPQPLLEAGGLTAPSSPSIDRIGETMGELPTDDRPASGSWTRWLIPTGLVLVLAAGVAFYEMGGVTGTIAKKSRKDAAADVAQPSAAPADAPGATSAGMSDATNAPATMAAPAPAATAPAEPPSASSNRLPSTASTTPSITAPNAIAVPAPEMKAPASDAKSAGVAQAATSAASASGETAEVQLTLTAPSWVEVRDASGSTLVSGTIDGGVSRTVSGRPPFSVKLGKASAVKLQFNGTPVALGPHTQREIARLTLPPAAR